MAELVVHNPYSGAELARLAWATPEELQATLERASRAFEQWRHSPAWERAQLLERAATELERRRDEFAALIRDEAGKPIRYAQAEVDRALAVLRYAAGEAQRLGGEILRLDAFPSGRPGMGIHQRFPRGVVLGITPFNFPLNLVLHKIAPALACGCSIVIKPSPATPLTALKLAELFTSAATPDLVQVALADDAATARLTRAPEIATISFTGSARVGKLIRAQAPEKPTTLELGGNAWVVVMDDIDPSFLPGIAKRIAGAAYGYAGQSCISVQNVAVAESRAAKLSEALSDETLRTPYGDPSLQQVISGPVINASAAERISRQIASALQAKRQRSVSSQAREGADISSLVAPTWIEMAPLGASLSREPWVQEELFGPVMTSRSFASGAPGALDSLIAQINSSPYGLQTGVFTQNWAVIEKLYRELRVGGLVVNDVPTTRYDHQPYGGVKESGVGREGIRYAVEEMTESKFLALSSTLQI